MDEKQLIIYQKVNEIVSLTLTLFPTPLGGFSPFSWWPLIFHFSSVTSLLRHRHLQHVCSFTPLLHSTHFIQCWVFVICMLPLAYLVNCLVFFILRSFCEIIVTLPLIQLSSLIAPSSLSSCNGKQFEVLTHEVDLLARMKELGRIDFYNPHIPG
jgi:hypothetical protein